MESVNTCKQQWEQLEKKIADSQNRWQTFLNSQRDFKSVFRVDGARLPAPVMTAEKRKKMQMYRKQAYIKEVRMRSQSREQDFMNKIQGALDEIREFQVNTSSSSDEVVSERAELRLHLSTTDTSSQQGNDSSLLETAVYVPKKGMAKESPRKGPLVVASSKNQKKAKSTTDLTQEEPNSTKEGKVVEDVIKGAKIHRRRRYDSEGKSDSDSTQPLSITASRPQHSSHSPNRSKRSQSSSNLLTIPFETYLAQAGKEDEAKSELSPPRQRYRDERARAIRTPPPQASQQSHLMRQPIRPLSTPPVISTYHLTQTTDSPNKFHTKLAADSENQTPKIISSKALKLLLENLDPSHDQPTHEWLAKRVSEQAHTTQDEISLDNWFQNAPDSVKQKLVSLLPKLTFDETSEQLASVAKSKSLQISAVQLCNSADDTLRSTSPIPQELNNTGSRDEEHLFGDYIPGIHHVLDDVEELPLVVVDKSPRANELASKSGAAGDLLGKQIRKDAWWINDEPEVGNNQETARSDSPVASASERKRTLSMQSYTLDEPSEALLNSTLNETGSNVTIKDSNYNTKPAPEPESPQSPTTERKSRVDEPKRQKSRIPTPKSGKVLLSKCELYTPSPATPVQTQKNTGYVKESTPVTKTKVHKHRQILKVLNAAEEAKERSVTPTPTARTMTPTPPERPKSEAVSGWNRSRSRSRYREETDRGDSEKRQHKAGSKIPRSKSCRKPTVGDDHKHDQKLKRSVSFNASRRNKDKNDGDLVQDTESPLRTEETQEERLTRARKQLALLKSKFAEKIRAIQQSPLPASPVLPDKLETQVASRRPQSELCARQEPVVTDPGVSRGLVVAENPPTDTDDGKENLLFADMSMEPYVRPNSRNLSYSERDDMPIGSVYTASLDNLNQKSSLDIDRVLSISHKGNRPSSANSQCRPQSSDPAKQPMPILNEDTAEKLAAYIRGHLCRKLFKCSRVRSTVKTIQDCKSLLPSLLDHSRCTTPLVDKNFQQRLQIQMLTARNDLHEVFFEMPMTQRMALIKQSEKVQARLIMRRNLRAKQMDQSGSTLTSQKPASRRLKAKKQSNALEPSTVKSAYLRPHHNNSAMSNPMLV